MTRLVHSTFLLLPVLIAACGTKGDDSGAPAGDGGSSDGGSSDGGSSDGGSSDTGATSDGGSSDGGSSDGGSGDTGASDNIAIEGSWDDSWGGAHAVSNDAWLSGSSTFAISTFDNDAGYAIAQNGASNSWNPELWSRFDWTWDGEGALYYCQTAYAEASEADALAVPAAAGDDLSAGCGGFSWTALRLALSIDGDWLDGWGGQHSISAFTWTNEGSTYDIAEASDADGWLVAQNGASNSWNAGLWSRFDWTWDAEGALWYCQTAYDAPSREDAAATPAADASEPATTGCGSFSWTSMSPR